MTIKLTIDLQTLVRHPKKVNARKKTCVLGCPPLSLLELDDPHLLVNGVEILMLAFRPVGVYLHLILRTAATA